MMSLRPHQAAFIICILHDTSALTQTVSAQPACGKVCVDAQPQVLQCKGPLMVPMGCPAAANGAPRLHRCLARVVDFSLPEGGGLTSTPVQLRTGPGEGLDQCVPSLCLEQIQVFCEGVTCVSSQHAMGV